MLRFAAIGLPSDEKIELESANAINQEIIYLDFDFAGDSFDFSFCFGEYMQRLQTLEY